MKSTASSSSSPSLLLRLLPLVSLLLLILIILFITPTTTSSTRLVSASSHEKHISRFTDFTDTEGDNAASWEMFDRVVVVPDIHGDHQKFVDVLVGAQIAEWSSPSSNSSSQEEQEDQSSQKKQELNWVANRTLLVQLGDLLDRGPDDKLCLDTMMRLQEQAPAFGSRAVAIIGNHEVLQLQGAYHYAHRDSAAAYGGSEERAAAFRADGKYGAWLRKLPAIVEAWDTVFVHAGLTKRVAQLGVKEINRLVWRDIDVNHRRENPFIFDDEGPVWTRLMVGRAKSDRCELVGECLELLQRKRIIVGHTPMRSGPRLMCDERLLAADVGLSRWMYSGTSIVELVRNETESGEFTQEVFFNELVPEETLQEQKQQQQQEELLKKEQKEKESAGEEKINKKDAAEGNLVNELKKDPSALDEIMQMIHEEQKQQKKDSAADL